MVNSPAKSHRDASMPTRVLVRDIMNSPVISASPDNTIVDVASKMKEHKIGSIVILERDTPVGVVTDWDIVSSAVARDIKPSTLKASEIMQQLHTIEGEDGVTEAARLLRKRNIKRLGVVYKNKLVGIISASDVISEKASLLRGEIGRGIGNVSGYCDECGEWSDLLQFESGTFTCEECRSEAQG